MALFLDPPSRTAAARGAAERDCRDRGRSIVVALVNNMPDPALEATEAQFSALLRAAADAVSVRLRFTFLPDVRRSPASLAHLQQRYWSLDALRNDPPDALIVTGAEPIAATLAQEPYWNNFLQLLEWGRHNTRSSIWSCLAAHAAVQALDGIARQRLAEKRFGVFEHGLMGEHPLVHGLQAPVLHPHSRWNDLPLAGLRASGYTILSGGRETGADVFVKEDASLLVFFQGHPEYDATTLYREFRRDVGRYLRGEQASYPTLPVGYFPTPAIELLNGFQKRAVRERTPALLADFPARAAEQVPHGWRDSAVALYRNWLSYVSAANDGSLRTAGAHV